MLCSTGSQDDRGPVVLYLARNARLGSFAEIIGRSGGNRIVPSHIEPCFWHSMEFNLNERSDVEETASLQADFEPVIDRKRGKGTPS